MWLFTVLVVSKSVGFLGLMSLFKATDIAKKIVSRNCWGQPSVHLEQLLSVFS